MTQSSQNRSDLSSAITDTIPTRASGKLIVFEEGKQIGSFPISPLTTIGRDKSNTLTLSSGGISRQHCAIQADGPAWIVRDLKSRNGTLLNNERIDEPERLKGGDILKLGPFQLKVEFEDFVEPDAEPHVFERVKNASLLNKSQILESETGIGPEYASLLELSWAFSQSRDEREIARKVLESVMPVVGADIGGVLLAPDELIESGLEIDRDILRPVAIKASEGLDYVKVSRKLSDLVFSQDEGILAVELGGDQDFATLQLMDAESVICVPIRFSDRIIGLIHVYSTGGSHTMDSSSLEYCLAVGDLVGRAFGSLNQARHLSRRLEQEKARYRGLQQKLLTQTELIGESNATESLREDCEKVAVTQSPVLITGEQGVGKEVLARRLHLQSERANEPFVTIECDRLTPQTFELELFGSESEVSARGGTKLGKFEYANGGTLFFKEIAKLHPELQPKLLRVLESQQYERVGGVLPVPLDSRVIATTCFDLEELSQGGKFLEGLFYHLNIVQLDVPPLRERRDDIPPLAFFFVDQASERLGCSPIRLEGEPMHELVSHEWPGNVRELKNFLERAVVVQNVRDPSGKLSISDPQIKSVKGSFSQLQPLTEIEKDYISFVLTQTKCKKKETSEILGINRTTLDRKIKQYEIDLDQLLG